MCSCSRTGPALAARGFAPHALAMRRPGIVYVSISAYGHAGPWAQRRGFDSLVQSASGIAWQEQQAAHAARHLPQARSITQRVISRRSVQ